MIGIWGIVNVTPDSFSDGGRYLEQTAALEHGRRLRGLARERQDRAPQQDVEEAGHFSRRGPRRPPPRPPPESNEQDCAGGAGARNGRVDGHSRGSGKDRRRASSTAATM